MTRLTEGSESGPLTVRDIPLLLAGFPVMVAIGLVFWAYGIYHDVRERISISLHGDRSEK